MRQLCSPGAITNDTYSLRFSAYERFTISRAAASGRTRNRHCLEARCKALIWAQLGVGAGELGENIPDVPSRDAMAMGDDAGGAVVCQQNMPAAVRGRTAGQNNDLRLPAMPLTWVV